MLTYRPRQFAFQISLAWDSFICTSEPKSMNKIGRRQTFNARISLTDSGEMTSYATFLFAHKNSLKTGNGFLNSICQYMYTYTCTCIHTYIHT
jgi:hypothetical protein